MAAALALQSIPASAAEGRITVTTSRPIQQIGGDFSSESLHLDPQALTTGPLDLPDSPTPDIATPAPSADGGIALIRERTNGQAVAAADIAGREAPPDRSFNRTQTESKETVGRANGTLVRADRSAEDRPRPAAPTEDDLSGGGSPFAEAVWREAFRLGFLKAKSYGGANLDGIVPADVEVSPRVKFHPSAADRGLAEAGYRRMADQGVEVLATLTVLQKAMHPDLQVSSFGLAQTEVVLTNIVNGLETEIPADIQGNVVGRLLELRAALYKVYASIRRRLQSDKSVSVERRKAIALVEDWHARGMAPPVLEIDAEDGWTHLRAPFQAVLSAALGRSQESRLEIGRHAARFEEIVASHPGSRSEGMLARAEAILAAAVPAGTERANEIYERSDKMAKDKTSPGNIRHMLARQRAVRDGTVFPVTVIDKQMRPTCTVNTLRALLAAHGVHRSLAELVREARRFIHPNVGISTAFTPEMQLRLFSHYGPVLQVQKDRLFSELYRSGRTMKIGINDGDRFYQHSVLLEGLYELDGEIFVSMRDAMSHYPTRMKVQDFAEVFIPENSLALLSVYPDAPRP